MPTTPTHLIPWPDDPGLPRRFYDGRNFRQDNRDQWADGGYFVDFETDAARRFVYEVRTTVTPQPTIRQIAEHYGFQHKLNAYSAYNTWQRRLFGSTPAPALRPNDCRSFTRRRRRADGTMVVERLWGCEMEFTHAGRTRGNRHPQLANIILGMRAAGYKATALGRGHVAHEDHEYWAVYGSSASLIRQGFWQGTYDGSVGMEFISPPIALTNDGLAELTTACELIRNNGGGAASNQGTHVHIGCGDLDQAGRELLVQNVQAASPYLTGYTPHTRRGGTYCAEPNSYGWADTLALVRRTGTGQNNHYTAYNFGHLTGRGTIEFRAMGHTLNASKLRVWIRVCSALVTATAAGHRITATTVDEFAAELVTHGGLSGYAASKFTSRVRRNTLAYAA